MAVTRKGYGGLDVARVIAAVLVVAIHTSPLLSINATADFVLTRAVARLAVPFFFMCSGFFLFKGGSMASPKSFTGKTLKLYTLAVALYLPLNLYAGLHRDIAASPLRALTLLLWEGTFYHLWYFPAVIVGAWLTYALIKKLGQNGALAVAALLYTVGLLGDSYYALFSSGVFFRNSLGILFHLIGTTRNGLFFAPLFLMLGVRCAARQAKTCNRLHTCVAAAVCLLLLVAEALLLRRFTMMQGDVLYILLPFASWFLFRLLAGVQCAAKPVLRSISSWVFILHPWCIAVLRSMFAAVGLPAAMETHSLLFFFATLVASFFLAWLVCLLLRLLPALRRGAPRAEAQIDAAAIRHNLAAVQALLPAGCKVMGVVKANAYGHGAVRVARILRREGVQSFCVATLREGMQLRGHGIRGEILVLGYTPPQKVALLELFSLTQTVADAQHAAALAANAHRLKVQIKADTGLHRLGLAASDVEDIASIYSMPSLRVTGIFTHFACADGTSPADIATTKAQQTAYWQLMAALRDRGIHPGSTHMQASYGAINYPAEGCSHARIGISLYSPAQPECCLTAPPKLRCAMRLKATVASVRTIPAGEGVGYGKAFHPARQSRIATLAIGYADGVPRALQDGYVLIHGQRAPYAGRIAMDQLMVDVTDIPTVRPGDTATLLGTNAGETITPVQLAAWCGTIPNEVLARLGSRVACRLLKPKKAAQAQKIYTPAAKSVLLHRR